MENIGNSCECEKERLAKGLVDITVLTDEFVIDLKYATDENFLERKIYPIALCAMQYSTAQKLMAANRELLGKGFRLKIWDAYRPLSVQKIMWEVLPQDDFVADPFRGGSIHNGGFAVDVTLVDMEGKELEMPSGFDDFSEKASRNNTTMTEAASRNLSVLTDAMVKHGFRTINSEWWHYNDEDLKVRNPLDVPLEELKGGDD